MAACPNCPPGYNPAAWRQMWAQMESAVAGGGPNALGICRPGQLTPTRDAEGCAEQQKYCRTPLPVAATIANGTTLVIPVDTTADEGFLFELVVHSPPVIAGQILLNSLFVGAHNYFPDGSVPVERYQQTYEGGNLLPQNVRITSSVGAKLSVTNNGAAPFNFLATFESNQLRFN